MNSFLENLFVAAWNRSAKRPAVRPASNDLMLGALLVDERRTGLSVAVPNGRRAEHVGLLGRTGVGKSSLIRHMAAQDIRARRGFLSIDLHNDTTPFLLRAVASEERRTRQDLSTRLIVIEPGDRNWSVGLNVLEKRPGEQIYRQLAECAEILKRRWQLDHLGARTEELLRNALQVLADSGQTIAEMTPLLSNTAFRALCLRNVTNPETESYFRNRFDPATEAMQAVYRDAVLNKISGFTSDPCLRHILGQRTSTFSLLDAIDGGYWVIVNLDKGRLGEQVVTLGGLLMTMVKNALFARQSRTLFTVYADELQNLVAFESGLETIYSEARKYQVSLISGSQFLDQYPSSMRSAFLAIGTHILFQLSGGDAEKMAAALDGGPRLAALLRNLPKRHFVIKSGAERWKEAVVPTVDDPRVDFSDLLNRCRARWARRRTDIETELQIRHRTALRSSHGVLNDWE